MTIYGIVKCGLLEASNPVTKRENAPLVALRSSQEHLNQKKDKMQILDQKCCLLFERKNGRSK